MAETRIEIFSDGACSGNPGPGGFGTILRSGRHEKELSGYHPQTTNNQMELLGAIRGLEALKKPCRVVVTTDSQYVIKGMTEWVEAWIARGWKTAAKKPVLNQGLWQRLVDLCARHQVEWVWVKGHNGHDENERCDELARAAIVSRAPLIDDLSAAGTTNNGAAD